MIGRIEEAEGHFDEALTVLKKMREMLGGTGNTPLQIEIIRLEALTGSRAEAERHLATLQRAAAAAHQRIVPKHLAYMSNWPSAIEIARLIFWTKRSTTSTPHCCGSLLIPALMNCGRCHASMRLSLDCAFLTCARSDRSCLL